MIVLFDGTAARPWGRSLSGLDQATHPPARRLPAPGTIAYRVYEYLEHRPATRAELIARLRITRGQAHAALVDLNHRGVIEVHRREPGACFGGTSIVITYLVKT